MRTQAFDGCCTARVLVDFGQEANSSYGTRIPEGNTPSCLNRLLDALKKQGVGIVTAILTQNQTHGIELLEGAGFKNTGWVSKGAHPETKIALFYLSLEDWKPKNLNDEWIRNRGSKSVPERARGKRVIVRFRDGSKSVMGAEAERYDWTVDSQAGDIMAYKIVGGE